MPKSKTMKNFCVLNNATKKCVSSETADETSNHCYRNKKTQRCHNYPVEFNETTTFKGFVMTQKAKKHLEKIILNKTPLQITKMRKKHEENELYIPIDEYTTDKSLKDYLANEVLELANYYAIEESQDIISVKAIKHVIEQDKDLEILLK